MNMKVNIYAHKSCNFNVKMYDPETDGKGKYGSDFIVDLLKSLGIAYVSLNPGSTFRELHDSIVNYGGNREPEIILCCHEEIAVSIAHGYNKAVLATLETPEDIHSQKYMAVLLHDTVGLLHASMAIFNAWIDRAPLFILGGTGPLAVGERRPWIDWIHTAVVDGDIIRNFVKWDNLVVDLQGAIDSIIRSHLLSLSEPMGPVFISIDVSLQKKELPEKEYRIPDVKRYAFPALRGGDSEALMKIAKLLVEAQNPVLIAENLAWKPGSFQALVELAELVSSPVIDVGSTLSFPNIHPLNLTGAEKEILQHADFILLINVFDPFRVLTATDRDLRKSDYIIPDDAKIADISLRYHITRGWIQEYGRLQPADISLIGDVSIALRSLLKSCENYLGNHPEQKEVFENRFNELKSKHESMREEWRIEAQRKRNEKPISTAWLALVLQEVVENEDYVLTNSDLNGWVHRILKLERPFRYLGSRLGAGLGYGMGYSLGIALAYRGTNRLCINIQPDGDLLYTPSGLWTASHHRIPLLTVMFNNQSYYNSVEHQKSVARVRNRPLNNMFIGTKIDDPSVDFAELARSFGVYGFGPVEDPEDLKEVILSGVNTVKNGKPALVDVITQPR
jgi:thiamine pyrophosphate-dependent acetolactate synthase large subunit-like protein